MIYQIKSAPPFSCDFDKTNICHINIPIKRSLPVNSSKKYYVCTVPLTTWPFRQSGPTVKILPKSMRVYAGRQSAPFLSWSLV